MQTKAAERTQRKKYTAASNPSSERILTNHLPNELDFHWLFDCLLG